VGRFLPQIWPVRWRIGSKNEVSGRGAEIFPESSFQGWTTRNGFTLVRLPRFPTARVVELVDTHV
jgi:hypothetical protein